MVGERLIIENRCRSDGRESVWNESARITSDLVTNENEITGYEAQFRKLKTFATFILLPLRFFSNNKNNRLPANET